MARRATACARSANASVAMWNEPATSMSPYRSGSMSSTWVSITATVSTTRTPLATRPRSVRLPSLRTTLTRMQTIVSATAASAANPRSETFCPGRRLRSCTKSPSPMLEVTSTPSQMARRALITPDCSSRLVYTMMTTQQVHIDDTNPRISRGAPSTTYGAVR